MDQSSSEKTDIMERFEKKLMELEETLPPLDKNIGNSCAADTLNSIMEVIDIKDTKNYYFNNLAVPFSGFAHFKGMKGWIGPCGAVSGAIAAIGIITGGHNRINDFDVPRVYGRAIKYAERFEKKFGSLICKELCGYDLTKDLEQYVKNRVWEKKCCSFVKFAVEQVSKLTRRELKSYWD